MADPKYDKQRRYSAARAGRGEKRFQAWLSPAAQAALARGKIINGSVDRTIEDALIAAYPDPENTR